MTMIHRISLAALALPLSLALAACGGETTDGAAPKGEPVAKVAAPAGKTWGDTVTVTEDGGYLMGNPAAPIKLVEYGSLTCPACAAFAEAGSQPLRDDYVNSGRVSFEFRSMLLHGTADLVLTGLIGCGQPETAIPLADQVWANLNPLLDGIQANGAAIEQGMSLPENQRFVAFADRGGILDFFAARGISRDQGAQCLANFESMKAIAEKSQSTSTRDEVNRTPTFFLNGNMLDGTSWPDVEAALQAAGAR